MPRTPPERWRACPPLVEEGPLPFPRWVPFLIASVLGCGTFHMWKATLWPPNPRRWAPMDCTYPTAVVLTLRFSTRFAWDACGIHAIFASSKKDTIVPSLRVPNFLHRAFGFLAWTFPASLLLLHALVVWILRSTWSSSFLLLPVFTIATVVALHLVHWVGPPRRLPLSLSGLLDWTGVGGGGHTVASTSSIRSTTSQEEKKSERVGSGGSARRWRWRRRRTRCRRRRTSSANAWRKWKRNTRTCKPASRCTSSRAGACAKTRMQEQALDGRRSTSVTMRGGGGNGVCERGVVD